MRERDRASRMRRKKWGRARHTEKETDTKFIVFIV